MYLYFLYFSKRNSLRKSNSDSRNLNRANERIPQSIVNNQAFSIHEKELEDRLENKDDSDYWSTPSSSIRYYKNDTEDDAHALSFEDNHFQRTSSAQKFRRSFQKYTGTVIRSPLDRINGVNPPRRLLRNNFIDGCDNRTQDCISSSDMIELSPIKDETKSVDTCSTTTNVSIKDPSYGVLI